MALIYYSMSIVTGGLIWLAGVFDASSV